MLFDIETIKKYSNSSYYLYNQRDIANMYVYIYRDIKKHTKTKEIDIETAVPKICRKIQELKKLLNADFIYDYSSLRNDDKNNFRFTRSEAIILLYICLYQSNKNSLIYKLKRNDRHVSSDEVLTTINSIKDFMLDERFKKDGAWYKKEYKLFIEDKDNPEKTIEEINDTDVNIELNNMYNYYELVKAVDEFENNAYKTIHNNLKEIINNEELKNVPFFNYDKSNLQYNKNNQSTKYSYSEIKYFINSLNEKMTKNINEFFIQQLTKNL